MENHQIRGLPWFYICRGRRPPGHHRDRQCRHQCFGGGQQCHDGELRTGHPLHGFVMDQPSPRSAMEIGLLGYRREGATIGPPARSTRWRLMPQEAQAGPAMVWLAACSSLLGCASGLCQAFSVTLEKGGHDASTRMQA